MPISRVGNGDHHLKHIMSKFYFIALLACAFTAHPLIAKPTVVVTLASVGDRVRSV